MGTLNEFLGKYWVAKIMDYSKILFGDPYLDQNPNLAFEINI